VASPMEMHGSESYFVIGEGLLTESGDGRDGDAVAARVASAAAADVTPPFRFSRMGPRGVDRQLGEGIRQKVAREMAAGGGGTSPIPAGFTYLGQFTDHDLTFDKTTVMLGQFISPAQLLQARSPSLDLDSLYGAGPSDPESAKFYSDDRHLKMGKTLAEGGLPAMDGFDLPRGMGNTAAKKRKAVIPDPRNDENLAVAQTHLAMIRFHNRVVDTLPSSVPAAQRFEKAREIVTKHYQWMIRTDYLPRICQPGIVNNVFSGGRKVFEVGVPATDVPTMPIEFSVAAFRLGHSMIRREYNWNAIFDFGGGSLDLLFTFSAGSRDLGGGPRLPSTWIADWRRLYDFKKDANKPGLAVPANQFNRAMRIDTGLVVPLKTLPTGSFGGPNVPQNDPRRNLAFRNLTRARMVRLATGQQMMTFIKGKGVNLTKLTKTQIRDGKNGADLSLLTQSQRDKFLKDTPLWFYILREAELNGGRLKGVGGRIVAETFHRAMQGSTHSIVRDTAFKPSLGPNNNTFRMVDLLLFAFEGKKKLLAPLG
jgi:Animal haem peroxidase